jgi:hypothetical protein
MTARKESQSKLDWLYILRDEEVLALEKLDISRSLIDSTMQIEALNELQRIYTDFAFAEYLYSFGNGQYKIDYSYYSDWKNNKKIKTIHSEIEREENNRKL